MRAQYTQHQTAWMGLAYGMFLHFGPNTLEGTGWGAGTFPASEFVFKNLNIDQWAHVAKEAGMKYAVLTTKHHDGFCLWPSKYTDYCVKNAPDRPDIVGMFVEAFRKAGLKTGIYYSLWDRNYPDYENDSLYAEYMRNQLTELLTNYGEIISIFFDGNWDKDHPTREWPTDPQWKNDPNSGLGHGERWGWRELYDMIHQLQPGCLVTINSSSDLAGQIKYPPADYRTSEHLDFIYQGKRIMPHLDPYFTGADGQEVKLPLEICGTLPPHWFYIEKEFYLHPSVETICGWYHTARNLQANFLLNVGPDNTGLIPEYHQYYLSKAAARLF